MFLFQVLPDSLKTKDDVDGTSTMDEFVAVAVSGARGRISCLFCLVLELDNSSSFFQGVSDLYKTRFVRFYFSFFTLVLVLIEKIFKHARQFVTT